MTRRVDGKHATQLCLSAPGASWVLECFFCAALTNNPHRSGARATGHATEGCWEPLVKAMRFDFVELFNYGVDLHVCSNKSDPQI